MGGLYRGAYIEQDEGSGITIFLNKGTRFGVTPYLDIEY
jgi:hypothetical protein